MWISLLPLVEGAGKESVQAGRACVVILVFKPILQVKQKHIWSGVQGWLFGVVGI